MLEKNSIESYSDFLEFYFEKNYFLYILSHFPQTFEIKMKISEDIRKTIKILVQQGQTPAQIKHIIPSTVSWCGLMGIIKRLAETGSTDDRKRSGRPRSIRTNTLKKK